MAEKGTNNEGRDGLLLRWYEEVAIKTWPVLSKVSVETAELYFSFIEYSKKAGAVGSCAMSFAAFGRLLSSQLQLEPRLGTTQWFTRKKKGDDDDKKEKRPSSPCSLDLLLDFVRKAPEMEKLLDIQMAQRKMRDQAQELEKIRSDHDTKLKRTADRCEKTLVRAAQLSCQVEDLKKQVQTLLEEKKKNKEKIEELKQVEGNNSQALTAQHQQMLEKDKKIEVQRAELNRLQGEIYRLRKEVQGQAEKEKEKEKKEQAATAEEEETGATRKRPRSSVDVPPAPSAPPHQPPVMSHPYSFASPYAHPYFSLKPPVGAMFPGFDPWRFMGPAYTASSAPPPPPPPFPTLSSVHPPGENNIVDGPPTTTTTTTKGNNNFH